MSPLSEHIAGLRTTAGKPVAAINGGFYRRDKAYAGAARGLQIVDGEILSAPNGGPCFWMDVGGGPHIENIKSRSLYSQTGQLRIGQPFYERLSMFVY